jgi:hypothetical protein
MIRLCARAKAAAEGRPAILLFTGGLKRHGAGLDGYQGAAKPEGAASADSFNEDAPWQKR